MFFYPLEKVYSHQGGVLKKEFFISGKRTFLKTIIIKRNFFPLKKKKKKLGDLSQEMRHLPPGDGGIVLKKE